MLRIIRVIDDKEHQEILDSQDLKKIKERQGQVKVMGQVWHFIKTSGFRSLRICCSRLSVR